MSYCEVLQTETISHFRNDLFLLCTSSWSTEFPMFYIFIVKASYFLIWHWQFLLNSSWFSYIHFTSCLLVTESSLQVRHRSSFFSQGCCFGARMNIHRLSWSWMFFQRPESCFKVFYVPVLSHKVSKHESEHRTSLLLFTLNLSPHPLCPSLNPFPFKLILLVALPPAPGQSPRWGAGGLVPLESCNLSQFCVGVPSSMGLSPLWGVHPHQGELHA